MNAETLVVIATTITALSGLVIGIITQISAGQRATVTGLQDALNLLREENRRLAARLEEYDHDRLAADKRLEAHDRDRLASDKRLDELQCELEKVKQARESTARENEQLRERVRAMEAKIEALEKELAEWRAGLRRKSTGPLPPVPEP